MSWGVGDLRSQFTTGSGLRRSENAAPFAKRKPPPGDLPALETTKEATGSCIVVALDVFPSDS